MLATSLSSLGIWEFVTEKSGWFMLIDLGEIAILTALIILKDLSNQYRPFDWHAIIFTIPFALLVGIQCLIVSIALVVLVSLQRATFGGFDAWWVALAGISILKSFPIRGNSQDRVQLSGLTDWLFKSLYTSLQLIICHESRKFADHLIKCYERKPVDFLQDTQEMIEMFESVADASIDKEAVAQRFAELAIETNQVRYLANWVAPRTSRGRWKKLTGN